MKIPRYNVVDADNSCYDPDCCGGPYPYYVVEGPITTGEYIEIFPLIVDSDEGERFFIPVETTKTLHEQI